ncbi:MAG: Glucosamine/fructose-6-phosphate aminotransferase, isomerizing [candidate division WS6 bacterium GW2011_GWA2_37_6]|uniref:Glutamine--fructose-6-phosphate aminotransferase [isomerizing] n=1 Tax=candidate division WS6 bacterium GW2011_GWA2_37_6 TaxID=1619087 RepID=A0A0G0GTX8_9BACT|nr:MAG: Glucosamine/fructose-6-phosphate aminotransferase, isomerizing [candidate division WS6 bacterium GW2011_GWA2_37_6]
MCGIFGYIGKKDASSAILEGLKRLEYRGYDSWGVAVIDSNKEGIKVQKKIGAIGDLSELKDLPKSHIGIGHTRWATHGGVTTTNAHPHYSSDNSFVLAQNGIVENYQELKKELLSKGYKFITQTDTEIIVRLVEDELKKTKDLRKAFRAAFLQLDGRNTVILLSSVGEHVIAIRNGSPLVIGISPDESFFASDTLSFANKTDKVVYMNDFEMVEYKDGKINLFDVKSDKKIDTKISKLDHEDVTINKEGFEHYMLKEILDQKYTIKNAVSYTEEELRQVVAAVKKARNVYTLGAGGAFYAADQVAYLLRTIANIPAIGLRPYEIESNKVLVQKGDLIIVISQSGETADNLEALKQIRDKGIKIASAVNMLGSTTTRISDYPFFSRTGPELCVLSTKSGSAQMAFGYLLAKNIIGEHDEAKKSVDDLSKFLEKYLNDKFLRKIEEISTRIYKKEHAFLLGKGRNYQIANIGALNIKEASYLHAEGFTAGELKHGVIALIDKGTPVFSFVDDDEDNKYMIGATAEVKARGAYVIGLSTKNNELFDEFIELPTVSGIDAAMLANTIPCQLFAYFIAKKRGYNPDKPRNLAKSVTVK